ncbi:MAG: host-nuclease inhibitor Gam family protein [Terriglobia bacterium]
MACWAEADAALAALGRLAVRLEGIERERQAGVARAQAAAARASQGLEEQRQALEAALEGFCRRHGPELARLNGHSRRSRRLLFGRVGYRRSQGVVVRSEAAALRALAQWRAGQKFLRVRSELDREGLRRFLVSCERRNEMEAAKLVAGRLRRAGIALERRESWFYQVDRRAVERWGERGVGTTRESIPRTRYAVRSTR